MTTTTDINLQELQQRCTDLRLSILQEIEVAGSGHYGSSLSVVELLISLYYGFLRIRPDDPQWSQRDRFFLSKGHACSALYPILADLGYLEGEELNSFTRLGSSLGDHPDCRKVNGIEFSSGSLGHGLAVAVGMAEAVYLRGWDSRIVVLLGDGEHNEGQVWEAGGYAAARRLRNLLVIVDANRVQVDGTIEETLPYGSLVDKWRAFGWRVLEIDGHDLRAIQKGLAEYESSRQQPESLPTVLLAHTTAGKGIPFIENRAEWHLGYLGEADRQRAEEAIRTIYPSAGTGGSQ